MVMPTPTWEDMAPRSGRSGLERLQPGRNAAFDSRGEVRVDDPFRGGLIDSFAEGADSAAPRVALPAAINSRTLRI